MGGGHEVSVLIDVNLRDLVPLGRLEDQSLAIVDLLHYHLREGNVSEFEFSLVFRLFEAHVEEVD